MTYSTFDLLSDIGGLSGMLYSIFAFFMRLWMYNYPDNFMVSQLFKVKRKDKTEETIDHSMARNCKELLYSWLPC